VSCAEDGSPEEWKGEVAVAVLDTATLAEAALVLRKYSALCVNDTMFYVRWLPSPPLGLCSARVHVLHLPVRCARTIVGS